MEMDHAPHRLRCLKASVILGSDDHQKGPLAITEVLAAFAGPAGHFKELAGSGMGQAAWDVEEEKRPG